MDVNALREASIERLADAVETHLDTALLESLLGVDACAL
jgi:adenosylcobyric acid synthase